VKKQRVEIASYRGGRRGSDRPELILWGLAAIFLLAAVAGLFFYTPMRVTGAICLALAVLCAGMTFLNRWAQMSRDGVVCRRIVLACFAAMLIIFAVAEGFILWGGSPARLKEQGNDAPDAVIVLGAGVNGKTASVVLQSRIDAAAAFLNGTYDASIGKCPDDIPVILSGGQGRGEDISEAQCMYDALAQVGVDSSRLYTEEGSTTTAENFANAGALLSELGIDPETAKVAVITSDFHVYRAEKIAAQTGLDAYGVPAQMAGSWWWLSANYYIREVFALGKLELLKLF
jgi:uncharacterized SAM-binding protein YcdF (DUF218 family)